MRNKSTSLIHWYFSQKSIPYWCILLIDSIIIICSGMTAFYLSNNGLYVAQHFWQMIGILLVMLIPYYIGFRVFHTYSGLLRYSTFIDLQRVALAMVTGTLLAALLNFLVLDHLKITHPNYWGLVFIFFVSTMLMWLMRVMAKIIFETTITDELSNRIFIYGASIGAISIAKGLINEEGKKVSIKGFVSRDAQMSGKRLMGFKIYASDISVVSIMKKKRVHTLYVSPLETDNFRNENNLINALLDANIRIMIPSLPQEWDGKSSLNSQQLKEVDIEDLLPREEIEINMTDIEKQLSGKRILITGAAGSIGSELVRQVVTYKPEKLILIDQAETPMHDIRLMLAKQFPEVNAITIVASINNPSHMEAIFRKHQPEYVFHAAAYKHVPMMETNPSEAVINNIYGTKVIADLSVKYGAGKFVMVSTDKAVNPTNVMGCSKRICEIYVQSLDKAIKEGKVPGSTQFVTTRFGNVLGSNGSVIPLFREQIKNGGPVTVTHPDIIRFFMLIPEACKLVLEAGAMGKGGEIYVFDMGQPVKIKDLAKRMIMLSGAKNVEIKYTGLREGEKLYEEILNDEEQTKPTFNKKIKIAQVREYEYAEVCQWIDELKAISLEYDSMKTVAKMKAIVPEYKSQNSKYQVLDKS